jgi:hypothetical protein
MANLNELAALKMVFEFVPVKDILVAAMHYYNEQTDTHSKDNADVCYKAVQSFLN